MRQYKWYYMYHWLIASEEGNERLYVLWWKLHSPFRFSNYRLLRQRVHYNDPSFSLPVDFFFDGRPTLGFLKSNGSGRLSSASQKSFLRLMLCVNALSPCSRLNGFSPVCCRMCPFRSFIWGNPMLCTSKTWGSPLCVLACAAAMHDSLCTLGSMFQHTELDLRESCFIWPLKVLSRKEHSNLFLK